MPILLYKNPYIVVGSDGVPYYLGSTPERSIKNKEDSPMKTLYQVIVVHNDKVVIESKVVAKDVEDAKFKSGTYGWLINEGLAPGGVTIIVNALGRVEDNARS